MMDLVNLNLEIELLLEAIYKKYGYDFRNYGKAHIKRRVLNFIEKKKVENVSFLTREVLYNIEFFKELLADFSINITEMFRDPLFYKSLIDNVFNYLQTYPFIKIWHAGCASGEEVYSMAILLKENDLLKKSQLYATDFNQTVIEKARDGIYPINNIKKYIENYQRVGRQEEFSDYYTAKYDSIIMSSFLKKKILFSSHNLVSDGTFGDMNMIVCRNVLIYFDTELQNRVIGLFYESLVSGGYLCIGTKESITFSNYNDYFEVVDEKYRIFKKKYNN